MTGDIVRLAELFARARRPVVFTGAGVSTELVIVNLAPTPLDARADLVICGKAGEVMAAVLEGVRA